MGDMGEIFNAMKEASKEKRAHNREASPNMLRDAGIKFESKNCDAHLIVKGPECLIDFWPGTGKWITRDGKKSRGVQRLIDYINSGCTRKRA